MKLFSRRGSESEASADAAAQIENEITEPEKDNLPGGVIDWAEISLFIEDMLTSGGDCAKGWRMIDDPFAAEKLQENSLKALHILYDDLYGFFYRQNADRSEAWRRMEAYIREKYGRLSDKALSRIISTYRVDDR